MSNKYVLIEKKNLILPLHILWIFRNDKAGTIMSSFNCPHLGQCYNKAGVVALMTASCLQNSTLFMMSLARESQITSKNKVTANFSACFWYYTIWNIQGDQYSYSNNFEMYPGQSCLVRFKNLPSYVKNSLKNSKRTACSLQLTKMKDERKYQK